MRLATVDGRPRVYPRPGARGICSTCGGDVVAKCGRIVVWHWAHIAADCDDWAEPDSNWHKCWQDLFPAEMREVVIGKHRADIVTPSGMVVELQHSSISTDDIRARERHYDRMIWIFDVQEAFENARFDLRKRVADRSGYRTFRWKHPRKSLMACRRPVLLDVGRGYLLRLGRLFPETPCGGWGHLEEKSSVVRDLLADEEAA